VRGLRSTTNEHEPLREGASFLQTESQLPAAKGVLSRPCPACGRTTAHVFRFRINGCDILQCEDCGLGRTETSGFDPAAKGQNIQDAVLILLDLFARRLYR
jgi:hypothetical protein